MIDLPWNPESGKTTQSSEEEMKMHVDNDVCAMSWEGNPECGEEMIDLPWNPVEELLTVPEGGRPHAEQGKTAVSVMLMGLGAIGIIATVVLFVKQEIVLNRRQCRKVLSLAATLVLAVSAWSLALVDASVVILTVSGCCFLFLSMLVSTRSSKTGKCVP